MQLNRRSVIRQMFTRYAIPQHQTFHLLQTIIISISSISSFKLSGSANMSSLRADFYISRNEMVACSYPVFKGSDDSSGRVRIRDPKYRNTPSALYETPGTSINTAQSDNMKWVESQKL